MYREVNFEVLNQVDLWRLLSINLMHWQYQAMALSTSYSRITLKSIQCDWDEFFVASVITASKEVLYQSHIAIT